MLPILNRSCLISFQFALAVVAVLGFVFRRILEKYFKNPSSDFPPNPSTGGRIHRSNYLTDQISETTPSLINETGNGNEIPEVVLQMPSAPPTYWEATKIGSSDPPPPYEDEPSAPPLPNSTSSP